MPRATAEMPGSRPTEEGDPPLAVTRAPPEEQAAIQEAGNSPDLLRALQALTAEGQDIRGCRVNPERAHLQALQNLVEWTIGGYDTRPVPETLALKETDRLNILLRYRQPPDPGNPPRVAMYNYLCDTLFHVPMRKVGPEVKAPTFQDLKGNVVAADWVEADWQKFRREESTREGRLPAPVFAANRYPYQLPVRPGLHELQRRAQHWIMWYFHFPEDPLPNPSDEVIDNDVRRELRATVSAAGFSRADYIWYRNPSMSVPEVFHVQVFWIIPNSES